MEIPVAAGPWLVLGVVLGIALSALAALAVAALRRHPPRTPAQPRPLEPEVDDLPGFLENPPGSAPVPEDPPTAWPALSAPPATAAAPPPEAAPDRDDGTRGALLAMALAALLLVGAAAAVATAGTDDRSDPSAREPARSTQPGDVSAQLTFGGIVLQRHAVGVTVAYPRVRVAVRNGRPTAELELPTFNCLREAAPEDPGLANCRRSVAEHSQLTAPDLDVQADGDGFRLSGAFPTSRRSTGSAPVPTGRVYDLTVRVAPRDGTRSEGSEPATGRLELIGERVGTSADGPNEISYAG